MVVLLNINVDERVLIESMSGSGRYVCGPTSHKELFKISLYQIIPDF